MREKILKQSAIGMCGLTMPKIISLCALKNSCDTTQNSA
ncbi:hypothetical protein LDG_7907 [Legionella drancourtii LLAP12]|uniref:Uncharacterized protein n=1 Tax=Legionella drancourtii LLAP12 TaxID=658187 RepID=G9ERJ2_9GAMM|nr:hypothetical protein LDG_7907 [Legionella drancourtii LLAP12]